MIRDLEIDFLHYLRDISSSFFDVLFQIITILGEKFVFVGILAVIYFAYNKDLGKKVAFAIFTSQLLNSTIKGLIKYPRPFVVDETLDSIRKETATGYSFPSGHTQSAAVFYSSVVHFGDLEKKLKLSKKVLWIIALILILLISFSRLVLAVHYPKDVIVGLVLGLLVTLLSSFLFTYSNKKKIDIVYLYLVVLIIFLPFIGVFIKPSYSDMLLYRDFYLTYALLLGFTIGSIIEGEYVNFDCEVPFKTKLLRVVIAGVIFVFIEFGLKYLFPVTIFFDFLRYFLITFIPIGIYPLVFRKFLFDKK